MINGSSEGTVTDRYNSPRDTSLNDAPWLLVLAMLNKCVKVLMMMMMMICYTPMLV